MQTPAMHRSGIWFGAGAQQSALLTQRSARFEHVAIFGEHEPTDSSNSTFFST